MMSLKRKVISIILFVAILYAALVNTGCEPPFETELLQSVRDTIAGDAPEGPGGPAGIPGIEVDPATGLFTSESGQTASFGVVLATEPSSAVSIPVQISDTSEGKIEVSEIVFEVNAWSDVQPLVVTGVDDSDIDGDQLYIVKLGTAVSEDEKYNGIDPKDVTITNTDNDAASVMVDPVDGLLTNESGTQATFTVVLGSKPNNPVAIPISSSDPGEGVPSVNEVVFTAADWNTPQTITVSGVEDDLQDGNQDFTILVEAAESDDGNYNGIDANDVACINVDNDTAGITVNPTSGLITTEAGGSATFDVVLNSQPEEDVTIPFSSDAPSEGTVSPASVTFTSANWSNPKTITVTGVDDAIDDDNQNYTVNSGPASGSGGDYNGMAVDNVSVTNEDDDTAGFTLSQTSGLTVYEDPGHANNTDTFTVRLDSKPVANVSINISSSDTTEATVSPASMTFTSANWLSAQTATVTGEDDSANDGSRGFTIVLSSAISSDPKYSGMSTPNVSGTNADETRPVATPSISKSGTYYTPQDFTISCSTSGATIRYEIGTNPSIPTESSPAYSDVITVDDPLNVIKAKAFYSDWIDSGVDTKTIEIPFLRTDVANNIVADGASKLVVSPDNNYIYVGDHASNRIRKYTVNGSPISGDDINLGADAIDIFWESYGIFVSTDLWVKLYDPDTQALLKTYAEGLPNLQGIAADDELYVYNSSFDGMFLWMGVHVYNISTEAEITNWNSGSGSDLDVHPYIDGGSLYLSSNTSGVIRVYDYAGNNLANWNVTEDTISFIAAYTFDPVIGSNEYYVLAAIDSSGNDFVKRYDTSGNLVDKFEVPGNIKGIDAGSNNIIYVLTDGEDLLKYVKNY